jgi:hypothetical protein
VFVWSSSLCSVCTDPPRHAVYAQLLSLIISFHALPPPPPPIFAHPQPTLSWWNHRNHFCSSHSSSKVNALEIRSCCPLIVKPPQSLYFKRLRPRKNGLRPTAVRDTGSKRRRCVLEKEGVEVAHLEMNWGADGDDQGRDKGQRHVRAEGDRLFIRL